MSKVIYYFSGTGNSLYVAKLLSSGLDFNYHPMAKRIKDKNDYEFIDQIVLVFPMYNHSYPLIVKEFLKKLSKEFTLSKIHFSAVCTYGNDLGITLMQLGKLLRSYGGNLSLGYGIKMPYNYVEPLGFKFRGLLDSFVTREHSTSAIKEANEQANSRVKEIIQSIRDKENAELEASSVSIESLVAKLGLQDSIQKKVWAKVAGTSTDKNETFYDMLKHMDEGFRVNEKCKKCGLCISVCPVNNITKGLDGKPVFNHNCEQCFACVSWCPEEAIDFRESTHGRRRYHNPEVKVAEMVNESKCKGKDGVI